MLGRAGWGRSGGRSTCRLGAPVAVSSSIQRSPGAREALRQCQKEARAAAALRSPHVVQVLDFGIDDATGSPFIVMELLEGESLADRLVRRGKLSPAETARVLTHVARALSRAHDGWHHSPRPEAGERVPGRNDDEELAKVLDFGIARVQRAGVLDGSHDATGSIVGTPLYMSPEHISAQPVDHRTDLWAMAVMAFECLTGRRPFDANGHGPLVLQICTYPIPVPSQSRRFPPASTPGFSAPPGATSTSASSRRASWRTTCGASCPETTPDPEAADRGHADSDTVRLGPHTLRALYRPRSRRTRRWLGGGALLVAVLAAIVGSIQVRREVSAQPDTAPAVVCTAR